MEQNQIIQASMLNILAAAATILIYNKKKNKRRWWIRPIFQKKNTQGDYHNLLQEMRLQDKEMFFVYTRMSIGAFDYLLSVIGPQLKKTSNRPSISEGCRLAITLRILASGDSLQSISFAFRVGKSTVCNIFKETCQELWNILQPIYVKPPDKRAWELIAKDFGIQWNLPHCLGAIDGKHVAIKAPNKSGSLFYNYKKFYSIVLFAVCDSKYQFTHVDIGAYGSQSDGGVFRESSFGYLLNTGALNIPDDTPLPGTDKPVPHFFVGDEAFPLLLNLLRPYSGRALSDECRIFNYRLSRARSEARRIIENTFGIYAARWRIFHKTINAYPENVDSIIKATVCLHNFIKKFEECNVRHEERRYFTEKSVDRYLDNGEWYPGEWRTELADNGALQSTKTLRRRLGTRNAKMNAISFRNYMKDYVCNTYPVHWQLEHINKTK